MSTPADLYRTKHRTRQASYRQSTRGSRPTTAPRPVAERKERATKPPKEKRERPKALHFLGLATTECAIDMAFFPYRLSTSEEDVLQLSGGPSDTLKVFEWLLDLKERYRTRVFVVYSGEFQWNLWVSALTGGMLRSLGEKGECTYPLTPEQRYRIWWVPQKSFRVARQVATFNGRTGFTEWVTEVSVQVSDVAAGFDRMSLGKACQAWGVPFGDVQTYYDGDALYLEAHAVAALMERWRDAMRSVGFTPRAWYGYGPSAVALLEQHGVKAHLPDEPPPKPVQAALLSAYHGGRVEDFAVGTFPRLEYYDINSAYPAELVPLPSLHKGRWHHVTNWTLDIYAIFRCRWTLPAGEWLAPFPVRGRGDALSYPDRGEGWYWASEVGTALASGLGVEVIEGWVFDPAPSLGTARPFGWVEEAYARRKQLEADGRTAEAAALKGALAAISGKLAQGRGYGGLPPTYQSWQWAGMLTAGVRAKLLDAMAAAGDTLVACSTDAVFTYAPIHSPQWEPEERIGPGLGQWKHKALADVLWIENGVYAEGVREDATVGRARTMGLPAGAIPWPAMRAAWNKDQIAGRMKVTVPRFVGLRSAVNSPLGLSKWRTTVPVDYELAFWPAGKVALSGDGAHDRWRLRPPNGTGWSEPYRPKVGGVSDSEAQRSLEYLLSTEQP